MKKMKRQPGVSRSLVVTLGRRRPSPRDNADSRLTSGPLSAALEEAAGRRRSTADKIFNSDLKGYLTITDGPPCLISASVFFPSTAFNLFPSAARFTGYCSRLPLSPRRRRCLMKFPWQLATSTCVSFRPVGTPQGKALS